jgi:hypothetical protein
MKCNTTKEGYAMVFTCFLDELGINDVNNLKVRTILESTCIPYKANGEFAKEWKIGRPMYLHACHGILNFNKKMLIRYGNWVAKGLRTLEDESDIKQMFDALSKHYKDYSIEHHKEIVKKTRTRLLAME